MFFKTIVNQAIIWGHKHTVAPNKTYALILLLNQSQSEISRGFRPQEDT